MLIIFIDNALSFTPSGGRVTIYAREEPERVRVVDALGEKDEVAARALAALADLWGE